jgi:hypothetical protein
VGCTAPPGLLRVLDGDARINADFSASEGGVVFHPVIDGTPQRPWISSARWAGHAAIAFAVPTDMSGVKQRIEYKLLRADEPDGLRFGDGRYAGFAFKLGAAPDPFAGTAIFWQAWQGAPWGPPVSLKLERGDAPPYRVRLAVRNEATGPDSAVPDLELWSAALIVPDVWHTFLIHVEPRYDQGGHVELWLDGAQVVDWRGPLGYDPAQVAGALAGLDLKNGIYQPTANNGHTFYLAQMVVATSYAAAAAALGF